MYVCLLVCSDCCDDCRDRFEFCFDYCKNYLDISNGKDCLIFFVGIVDYMEIKFQYILFSYLMLYVFNLSLYFICSEKREKNFKVKVELIIFNKKQRYVLFYSSKMRKFFYFI